MRLHAIPFAFVLTSGILGAFAALLAVINDMQVFLGRQLVKPSASKRSAPQLRTESAAGRSHPRCFRMGELTGRPPSVE